MRRETFMGSQLTIRVIPPNVPHAGRDVERERVLTSDLLTTTFRTTGFAGTSSAGEAINTVKMHLQSYKVVYSISLFLSN